MSASLPEAETAVGDTPGRVLQSVTSRRIAWLNVTSGPHLGRRYPVKDSSFVGRGERCDIRLDHPAVSRKHAHIRRINDSHVVIQDLQSRNGTRVNGSLIEQHRLHPGDKLQFGSELQLLFTVSDPLEEQLMEAQKMIALGRLSAGITHDFNNLLSVLCANIDYLTHIDATTPLSDQEVRTCLAELSTATQRATELTRRLGGVVRGEAIAYETVNLTELAQEVLRLLQRLLPHAISVESAVAPDLYVEGSPTRLHQMLMNPCLNARDAMPEGGKLVLSARRVDWEVAQLTQPQGEDAQAAGAIMLEISDTGLGMDPAAAARAFDPFFTTKGPERGTGLGLSTLLAVAREHGGQATLESEPGKGTTVRIVLPAKPGGAGRPKRALGRTRRESVTEHPQPRRIVIVDVDPAVARSIARILQAHGHQTAYAQDLGELFSQLQNTQPDLVLLDLELPHLHLDQTIKDVRQMAHTAVVCMSAHHDPNFGQQVVAAGAAALLQKPLNARTLRQMLVVAGLEN